MCGIIGYLGPKDVVPLLVEGLKKLEYRGYDSAGLAVVDGGQVHIRRVKGKIKALEESLAASPLSGVYGLGHTRWATHGRPSEENAHPHGDCTGTLAVVHNGIIENYLALKEGLTAEGHVFRTETDTEVIAHLIEKHFQSSLAEAVRTAACELEGDFAIACVSTREPETIVVAKSGPPAIIGLGEKEFLVASDVNPILAHTRDVLFLDDGDLAVVTASGVHVLDFDGRPREKRPERIAWSPLLMEKRGFKHFMLKEIFEQPEVVRDTLLGRTSLDSGAVFLDEVEIARDVLARARRVVVVACGTSYHAALIGRALLETLTGLPVDVEYGSEFRYRDAALDLTTLVILVSQSGETADTLAALRAVNKKCLDTLAVTNVQRSSLAREAHGVLYTHAGPEIGVAATKTFTAQLTALALFALYLAQVKGTVDEATAFAFVQEMQRLPHKMEKVLAGARLVEDLAQRYLGFSHFLYLGRWVNFPVALEGALKLKEISYTHAEGYAGGEMKHGPIALIDEKMVTLAVAPRDRVYEKMLSNISEVRARGGRLLAVAQEDDREMKRHVDAVIPVPATHPLLTPFLTILPLQLFAYHIAAARGADVDQPRNLAKSVTVE
ncbi:MAG: glutamine--fructose-6-phosphate transaminase (isomerizing) [Candidatus Aminicenantes bacterium]|nr:glutamine--fructose-6-phosphate transaminase (isomerizing) [Candidatus Aminicenantes bacterium]